MKLRSIALHHLEMPLVAPFTTSFSTQTVRHPLLVEVAADFGDEVVRGWGECVAMNAPVYSPEYVDGAAEVIRRWIAPLLFEAGEISAETVASHLAPIVGHRMAKGAIEMAVLDAQLRHRRESFAQYLGVTRSAVPSGVSVGIQSAVPELLDVVSGYVEEGYARIKLKIKPGYDLAEVRAVRERFGFELPFQVDANTAYTLADASHLRQLDEFRLLLMEQPLGEEDLRQHAELARMVSTPICLDESIVSAEAAADAIALRAASVINIKPGRVGGYLEARRIHDIAHANGIAVWCGGMLETGIGRAANIALAALPGFTLPGDISGSNRFYARDVTSEPIVMRDGTVEVPTGPGFGAEIDAEALNDFTVSAVELSS